MSEASDELMRVVEYLAARGQRMKHEAHELLAKTDCRNEGERHAKAAVMLIQAQDTLAICTELAAGTHHKPARCTCSTILPRDPMLCPRHG